MRAPLQIELKGCEVCQTELPRRPRECRADYMKRRFCSHACSGAARRTTPAKPPKPPRLAGPEPEPPRVINGIWRPAAPGWPDQPQIPSLAGAL